jgi:hypothetical protein
LTTIFQQARRLVVKCLSHCCSLHHISTLWSSWPSKLSSFSFFIISKLFDSSIEWRVFQCIQLLKGLLRQEYGL